MIYDLHSHTTFSDGTLRPAELVARARARGVDVLAVTDHDTVNGLPEALAAAQEHGLRLIPGVEISVTWYSHTLHIVGLGVDHTHPTLVAGLELVHERRIERAKAIAAKLVKAGMEDAWERCCEMAGTDAITRTHFARYLVEKGKARELQQAFKRWLGHKGKAYVSAQWIGLEEAVACIRAAGGQAVLAHPGRYKMSRLQKAAMVEAFKLAGGEGIEVSCSSHDTTLRMQAAELATRYGLMASAGSDFHSPGLSHIELGYNLALAPELTPVWSQWN